MRLLGNICLWFGTAGIVLWFPTRTKCKKDGNWETHRRGAYLCLAIDIALFLIGFLLLPLEVSPTVVTSSSRPVEGVHQIGSALQIAVVVICIPIAVVAGAWRSYCSFWELKLRSNVPAAWRQPWGQLVSWLIVGIASVCSSYLLAGFISKSHGSRVWWAWFLVFLSIRWIISGLIGYRIARRQCVRLLALDEQPK